MLQSNTMSLEALIGRHLVVGLPGTTLTADLAKHLRAIHAGGFIAFERNVASPERGSIILTFDF